MIAKRSTSKKRSGPSGSLPPDLATFFLDRCFGGYEVANGLRANGLSIEVHKDHFDSHEEDASWIPEVGKRGWIIITKDKHIRTRQLEIIALLKSGQPAFVLTSGNATAADNVKSIMVALPQMAGCIRTIPPPFVAQITMAGILTVLMTHSKLMELSAKNSAS